MEVPRPPTQIVLGGIGMIETDAKAEREGFVDERRDLMKPVEQRFGGVGEHHAWIMVECVFEDRHHFRRSI